MIDFKGLLFDFFFSETFFANVPHRSMLHREIESFPAIDANTIRITMNVQKKKIRVYMAENAGETVAKILTYSGAKLRINKVHFM